MSKQRVQVSKDKGRTWKFRWVDSKEFDPANTVLQPGDWVRAGPESERILVVGLRGGRLFTAPINRLREYMFSLPATGETYTFFTEHPEEANQMFVEALLNSGKLVRKSAKIRYEVAAGRRST